MMAPTELLRRGGAYGCMVIHPKLGLRLVQFRPSQHDQNRKSGGGRYRSRLVRTALVPWIQVSVPVWTHMHESRIWRNETLPAPCHLMLVIRWY